jgi:predicted peptidase
LIIPALLVGCGALAGCAAGESWNLAEGQHPETFRRRVVVEAQGQMLLYLPAGFRVHGAKRYPLLVFLHGSGESGTDLEKLKVHGLPKIVATRRDFPFIVASPQTPAPYRQLDSLTLTAMLDELLARLPIDRDRVYLTGISMGGTMSYRWASENPARFAAVVPVSGYGVPEDACRLKDLPIWAFHGAKDHAVAIERDEATIKAINACGGQARFTVDPEGDHDDPYWSTVYGNPELYDWLLKQHRQDAGSLRPLQ